MLYTFGVGLRFTRDLLSQKQSSPKSSCSLRAATLFNCFKSLGKCDEIIFTSEENFERTCDIYCRHLSEFAIIVWANQDLLQRTRLPAKFIIFYCHPITNIVINKLRTPIFIINQGPNLSWSALGIDISMDIKCISPTKHDYLKQTWPTSGTRKVPMEPTYMI